MPGNPHYRRNAAIPNEWKPRQVATIRYNRHARTYLFWSH